MLFAGFAVADPARSASSHHMTMLGIVLAGVLGTMLGSWVAYAVGRGGRLELLERHGARIHMGPDQIARADRWFTRYGEWAVFLGRMVPFVRAFVSLPAGMAKMPLVRFSVLSLLGSIPWVLALALAGHALGSEWTSVRTGFVWTLARRRGRKTVLASSAGEEEPIGGGAGPHPPAQASADTAS